MSFDNKHDINDRQLLFNSFYEMKEADVKYWGVTTEREWEVKNARKVCQVEWRFWHLSQRKPLKGSNDFSITTVIAHE